MWRESSCYSTTNHGHLMYNDIQSYWSGMCLPAYQETVQAVPKEMLPLLRHYIEQLSSARRISPGSKHSTGHCAVVRRARSKAITPVQQSLQDHAGSMCVTQRRKYRATLYLNSTSSSDLDAIYSEDWTLHVENEKRQFIMQHLCGKLY